MSYYLIKLTAGVIATIGLYSILYRETRLYRFFEHLFIGLSVGWTIVAFWTESLKRIWWDKMVGVVGETVQTSVPGYWLYAFLVPIGFMGYFVFSKRHNWISRVPIGLMLGFGAGQQILVWWTAYGPQIKNSMKTIIPTQWFPFFVPIAPSHATIKNSQNVAELYPSQALTNIIFIFTLVMVLGYFLYSLNPDKPFMRACSKWGKWLMMIGFGSIFGSTIMARFSLMIDRMHFIWIEWLVQGLLRL